MDRANNTDRDRQAMGVSNSAVDGRLLFEVHVGEQSPAYWAQREAAAAEAGQPLLEQAEAERWGRRWRRHELTAADFPWAKLGIEPRFVGSETTGCVAAVEPSAYHNRGGEEFERFRAAAAKRAETALIVSMLGNLDDDMPRSVLSRWDSSVSLPGMRGSISGRRLPSGGVLELPEGLTGADRDLALRLRNRASAAPWWALGLSPIESHGSSGVEVHEPGGVLEPLLVNQLGETVAGVWIPADEDWRWYVVPAGVEWPQVLKWLVERAVPEFVPAALRRVRSAELVDDDLLTAKELAAADAIRVFDATAAMERARLEEQRRAATSEAADIRFGLLYGAGDELVGAVRQVLEAAGFKVVELDAAFGTGVSGDLLASVNHGHWLIEVKAAAGRPSEDLILHLERHLQTWPTLGRNELLSGGVLVVNHQHALPPLERAAAPYAREAFVGSLRHPIVPTLALFGWWRDGHHQAVIDAITGPARVHQVSLSRRTAPQVADKRVDSAVGDATSDAPFPQRQPRPRRLWSRRRR